MAEEGQIPLMAEDAGQPAATKAPKLKVKFPDGKEFEFNDREKSKKDVGETGVKFYVRTGSVYDFDLSKVSPEITKRLALHGAAQKIGDAAAGEKEAGDVEEAFATMIERLYKGEWSAEREGGFAGASLLAQAVAAVSGKDLEAVKVQLRQMSDADKKALRAHPSIAAAIRKIEDERRAATDPAKAEELLAAFQ